MPEHDHAECPACGGDRKFNVGSGTYLCPVCGGDGTVPANEAAAFDRSVHGLMAKSEAREAAEEFEAAGDGVQAIAKERYRQLFGLGYDAAHDARHAPGDLIRAALFYLLAALRHHIGCFVPGSHNGRPAALNELLLDPMSAYPMLGSTPDLGRPAEELLAKAGAMIAAAIDRQANGPGEAAD